MSETWTLQQNLTNQVPRHHFLSSVFLSFSHFLLLNLGGLKGRRGGIGSSALGVQSLLWFIHPPTFVHWHRISVFQNRFFSSCRLPPGLQKRVLVQANSFHFAVWDSQRYIYMNLFAYAYNKKFNKSSRVVFPNSLYRRYLIYKPMVRVVTFQQMFGFKMMFVFVGFFLHV